MRIYGTARISKPLSAALVSQFTRKTRGFSSNGSHGNWARDRAPKARQIHSLGRQPQGRISQARGALKGRQIAAAASAAAIIFRLSVAASRLEVLFRAVFLGLTPQAMHMPPLRGWPDSSRGEWRLIVPANSRVDGGELLPLDAVRAAVDGDHVRPLGVGYRRLRVGLHLDVGIAAGEIDVAEEVV